MPDGITPMPSRQRTKKESATIRRSVAYQALRQIALIYKLEESLKDLNHTPMEWFQDRQTSIKPLVKEHFARIKQ